MAPQEPVIMERVHELIPFDLLNRINLQSLLTMLKEEVETDYQFSIRKSIGELKNHSALRSKCNGDSCTQLLTVPLPPPLQPCVT